jgi:hypothetical protein
MTEAQSGEPTLADVKAEADATRDELAKHEKGECQTAPVMGSTVIVHHKGKAAPAIVVDVREDGSLDVQIFRGDHLPHAAQGLKPVAPGNSDGWSWSA